jgi:hypothetical protein
MSDALTNLSQLLKVPLEGSKADRIRVACDKVCMHILNKYTHIHSCELDRIRVVCDKVCMYIQVYTHV